MGQQQSEAEAGSTIEQIRQRVRAGGLVEEGQAVVVMLSGGRDSVCLLDVMGDLCGSERVRALHVNYSLRDAAAEEEGRCRALCEELDVGIEVVRADSPPRVGNLHAWAREVRYAAATALAERLGAVIATGHTATDQVETILYRLAASPGRRSLLGMVPRDGRIVRPLLGVTREQTAEYCRRRGLGWSEDRSNDDPRYARARVRNGLVKALAAVHPAAIANVLRTAKLLREETELLEGMVDAELASAHSIAIERLRSLPDALQRMIVVRLAEQAAGTFVPQAGERVGEILALSEQAGRADLPQLHVGGLVAAVVERGVLRMETIQPRPQHDPSV